MHTRYFDLRDTKGQQKVIEDQISAAADILRQGGLIGIPTETVYGLGANALDEDAVRKIFEAKGRPQDNPLIIHIPGPQWLPRYCEDVPPLAYTLARKFWPGPLTMILKRKKIIPDATTAGLDTVGVRCPDHQVTLAIIRESGVPIAAPSANTSGRPSCTTAADVMEDMEGKIDAVVDGGPCQVGVESTIIDLTCEPPRLLRPGGLPLEALEDVAGPIAVDRAVTQQLKEGEQPKAPGMKYRHYGSYSMTVFSNLWQVMGRGKMPKIRSTRNASNGLCLHIGGDVLTPHCMNQTERALGLCSSDVLPDQYPIAAFGKMTISSGKSIIKKQATRKIITYGMTALYITLVSTPGGATPCK